MNTEGIIAEIDSEIQKLTEARNLLNGVDPSPIRAARGVRGRKATSAPKPQGAIRKSSMTPEGRKRIADAMRARWAAKKSTVKAIKGVKK